MGHDGSHANAGVQVAVAFQQSQSGFRAHDTHATLDANNGSRRHNGVHVGSAVRRLTPRECERLQGFPDDYTLIMVRGKPAADGPRYKALGNSMAVNVMRWIGERILLADAGKL
jgi:DNA (cytosine-5)-methyltransferase 1